MQHWEFLTVTDHHWVTLTFSHPQPTSVLAMFPYSPKESSESRVRIIRDSREAKEWRGSIWRQQVSHLGWEPISVAYDTNNGFEVLLFRRPLE